ncbi:MAG: deoxyribodipyrimidine photo-lyase [Deltaproteobacteria bacterium]|nr:deoxyribodipyrimidine photo-lyase [Deltaproteobacteria bacterium]
MIQQERIQSLNRRPERRGRFILYWLQASQRAACNHALEYALGEANVRNLPLVVFFGLTGDFPEANARHYRFMIEGLQEVQRDLEGRGIRMVVRIGNPPGRVLELAEEAALIVTDRGYLRIQKAWRQAAAQAAPCTLLQVETDAVVPVETASDHEEYAAATLRPKIQRHLEDYLVPLNEGPTRRDSLGLHLESLALDNAEALLTELGIDRTVGASSFYRGGYREAKRRLNAFLGEKLARYGRERNVPGSDASSSLSPYLHFGQISPLEIALAVQETSAAGPEARQAFLEELVVRRELAINFVHYNDAYDRCEGAVPHWARLSLQAHSGDARPYLYGPADWENARTHDPYWNAAQREMVRRGKMHNYMRMYWGKKILEWSASPEEAFRTALSLNNRYALDGRDPNGFAGVAWCFGRHDRPWKERSIFGKIRYMNAAGLERKFDMKPYLTSFAEDAS